MGDKPERDLREAADMDTDGADPDMADADDSPSLLERAARKAKKTAAKRRVNKKRKQLKRRKRRARLKRENPAAADVAETAAKTGKQALSQAKDAVAGMDSGSSSSGGMSGGGDPLAGLDSDLGTTSDTTSDDLAALDEGIDLTGGSERGGYLDNEATVDPLEGDE